MPSDSLTCGKCRENLPLEAFMPSQRKTGKWCRSCMRAWYIERSGGLVERCCNGCGETREVTARRASESYFYCSRVCKDKGRKLKAREAKQLLSRSCLHCGGTIGPEMRTDARFCSEQCNSSAHGSKRANGRLPRGSGRRRDIQRAYVIERDKSRCHLCGKQCEPDDIHLDHVVPLSLGGTHDESNLRVACVRCNTSKGATGRGEQLLLVG